MDVRQHGLCVHPALLVHGPDVLQQCLGQLAPHLLVQRRHVIVVGVKGGAVQLCQLAQLLHRDVLHRLVPQQLQQALPQQPLGEPRALVLLLLCISWILGKMTQIQHFLSVCCFPIVRRVN